MKQLERTELMQALSIGLALVGIAISLFVLAGCMPEPGSLLLTLTPQATQTATNSPQAAERPTNSPAAAEVVNVPQNTPQAACSVSTGLPGGFLHVRACGGVNCQVMAILPEGETVTILEPGAWHKVKAGNVTGYVNSEFCK